MGNPVEMVLLFNMYQYSPPAEYNSHLSIFCNVKQNMVQFPRELDFSVLTLNFLQ